MSAKSKATLAIFRVYRGKAGATNTAFISTPHSILLKPGLVVKIDDRRSRQFAFETCNEDGCHIGVPLTPDLTAELTSGKYAVLHFFDGGQRRVAVPVSLEGFTKAVKAMSKAGG